MNLPGIALLLHLKEVESTQTLARLLAEQGAEDRTMVWADRQTHGRGRLNRKWDSGIGGLYFSLILKPQFSPSRLTDLSLMTAHAVAFALSRQTDLETVIKPPNDVLGINKGKAKKLCGILTEASGNSRRLDWAIIGVGINVNNTPHHLPAASSLKALTGKYWDLKTILRTFLDEFNKSYIRFPESSHPPSTSL